MNARSIESKEMRAVISLFIVLNISAICLTTNRPHPTWVERLAGHYVYWTKIFQQWALFVPNPRTYVRRYFVDVSFRDDSSVRWHRPNPPNWDFFARHLAYNFQKWDLASNYLEKHSWLRYDLVRYVERIYHNDFNPPVLLKVISSSADLPPPNEKGFVQHDGAELSWREEVLLEYKVR